MEVSPGIHQLKVPIPNNPLGFLNAYLVKTSDGSLLIDTGWNTDEAFNSLQDQLHAAGVGWQDLKYIFITHAHPDHYGLVGRLVKLTPAKLIIHKIERSFLQSRYLDTGPLMDEMNEWMRINGVPEDVRASMKNASLDMLGLVNVAMPDMVVAGGEHLQLGDNQFEIIWTPGHSPGHICLYEPNKRLFFSGDHVLPRITPSVGMHAQSIGNPLADYLNALHHVATLPADLVFPAHGDVFTGLAARVAEIEEHHAERTREIVTAIGGGSLNAYQISGLIRWSTGGVPWENLPRFQQRMAVTETIAHLELGFAQSLLDKTLNEGVVYFSIKV
jgi:glyoxylase-like metal-dependent hydrolase (beta-lactamase superfamily II)